MVLVQLAVLTKEGDKRDLALTVVWLASFGGQDLQAQPVATGGPGAYLSGIAALPLRGTPGVPQVADLGEDMGGITGAHQLFRCPGGLLAHQPGEAAVAQRSAAAAGAGLAMRAQGNRVISLWHFPPLFGMLCGYFCPRHVLKPWIYGAVKTSHARYLSDSSS